MNTETNAQLSTIRTAVQQVLDTCKVAGLVVAVAYGIGAAHTIVLGADGKGNALSADSLFPLSSNTKLPIALAILRLCDRGLLSVNDPLRRFVPDAASAQSGITLKQLLTHTAGLPDYAEGAPAVDQMLDPYRQAQVCLDISPNHTPGTKVAYSDVDYALLAIAVERITGSNLHTALNELVIQPLGIDAWLGVEPPRLPAYMTDAADKHVGTRLERWNTPEWRALGAPCRTCRLKFWR